MLRLSFSINYFVAYEKLSNINDLLSKALLIGYKLQTKAPITFKL